MAETKLSKSRLFFIFAFFLISLSCLLVRLGFLQIFKSSKYIAIAQGQSRAVIEMQPARGKIIDRKGREFALDVRLDSVYAVSRQIKHKEKVSSQLQSVLGLDKAELDKKIHKDKLFVWIARKISMVKSEALRRMKVEGIDFIKESMRMYPNAETACHLVGFTGIDNDGLEGIELNYNSFLKGVPGWRLVQKDAKQRELISKEVEMVPPVDGYNVHLTIDAVIQAIAERELAAMCKKHNAKGGSVIVMEPKTGDILAMAMYPTYDLNNARNSPVEYRRNRAITDVFEPGSVFKTFTLASIVQNKTFSLDEKFNCEHGSWAVAGRVLHDHHGAGVLTFREVIEKSSNIGTIKGALRLGAEKFYKTIKDFGFGDQTGIGLTGEVGGILPSPKNWSRSSIINLPIGQGVAVTPIQLVTALNAIANDGLMMKPRIVDHVEDQDGVVIQSFEPEPIRQVVSKETALQVRTVLEGVVSRGTGKKAAVPGFKAAGKTGTAQKIVNGGYSHDSFWASFIGFVPYDEPKVVIAVSIDEPHPVIFGGEVAAPVFSKIGSQVLAYWQISQKVPVEVPVKGKKAVASKSKQTSPQAPNPLPIAAQ